MKFRALCVALLAAASIHPTAWAQSVTLSFSAWVPPSHMLVRDGMSPWMREVEKVTEGRVKMRLLPKAAANPVNHLDAVADGLADVAFISHSYTPARFPMTRIGVLPFAGDSAEVASVALWRIYDKHFTKLNEHKGVKLITIYTHGPGVFWNAKRPIRTIEDFAGLKMRVGGGIAADVANALGAIAVSKPAPESFELLSTGVVDGVMFPGESIVSFKLDKILKFSTAFPGGLYSDSHAVIMNEAAWKKISKADQDAITRISGEAMARAVGKAWDKNAGAGFDAFKAGGGQIIAADAGLVKAVADRTARFEQEWVKAVNDKGLNGAAIVAEYREELKKVAAGR